MTQAKRVFLAVLVTSFIVPFMASSINLAIPAIAAEFGVSAPSLSWVVSAYLLGSVAILLPMGKLGDIVGRKKLYRIGAALMAACTVAAGFAASLESLIFWRVLQGLATAAIFGTGMAMVVSIHRPEERGKIIGYTAASTYIGLSIGPIVGGLITHYLGWHFIFFITGIILLLSLWSIWSVEEEWYGAKGERFDWVGSACYMVASPAVLYGFSRSVELVQARYILLGGMVLLLVFLYHQAHSKMPIFDVNLFRKNTVFAMSSLAAMINYSATFAISFVLSLYLQLIRGFDAATAGSIMLLQPVIMALCSPKAGALSDRMQPRIVASVGLGLNAIGLAAFAFLDVDTPIWWIGVTFVVIGLGFALFSSPNNNAIMGAVEPKHYGVASSIVAVMRLVGQALSMAVVTAVLSVYMRPALSPEYLSSMLDGFRLSFGIFAVLCAIGIVASLARGKRA